MAEEYANNATVWKQRSDLGNDFFLQIVIDPAVKNGGENKGDAVGN